MFAPLELLAELISLRRLLQIILIVLVIAAATKAYFYGSTIESVVVTQTTIQSDSELADSELGLVDRVLSGRELRYFITLEKANGRAIESSPVPGNFADGIVFRPDSTMRIGQVDTLMLKRKQALKSETLLNVAMHESDPIVTGYRIEVRTNWSVFQRELD